jgi:Leucine-rich repeat (LRR) protein
MTSLKVITLCVTHLCLDATSLLLSVNSLVEFPPYMVERLTQLRLLDLSANDLQCLPENLGDLHELQELRLSKNQLWNLPASFKELVHLEVLDISYNHFQCLSTRI